MATGVEKTHPLARMPGRSPDRDGAKYRGLRPFMTRALKLARELRLLGQLPVPRFLDFSHQNSSGQ
jgi:hypothetical protein